MKVRYTEGTERQEDLLSRNPSAFKGRTSGARLLH